jgi:hypothetical protein
MNVSVYEYSGICNPKLKEGFEMTEPTTFYITAMGRKTETVKIILKCERIPKTNTIAVFRLTFLNRGLRRYSKTLALEF